MDEDDLDFTPTHGTSSHLASLFNHSKNSQRGNSSLTYTAPKPPKKDGSSSKNPQPVEDKNSKGMIIISKAVQAYKLDHRKYVNQGVSGIVISGCYSSHMYAIVIYKPSKEHLSKTTITKNFTVTISANNYVSFYDNNKQNWSVMFQTPEDVEHFVEKIAICKFYCHPETTDTILTQDLMPPSGTQAYNNSTLDVIYNCYRLTQESMSLIKSEVKEKINLSEANTSLAKGLVGSFEEGKRIVIVPHSLSGPLTNELDGNKDLLLKVKVEKIISELERSLMEAKSVEDGTDSPLDSSAEETSIKARGASIKEALVNTKAQKANLISRMARMGQATLPLKHGVGSTVSDSEEEISVITSSPKPRMPKNKSATSNIHSNMSGQPSQFSNSEASNQLSVYSASELAWQNQQLGKVGVGYQQLIPVTASPVSTPDPSVSVYISESRIQAAELRMGLSKITEKVDLVLNKIQSCNSLGNENQVPHAPYLDSSGIISSIKNLITENEHLKSQVEDQKKKIDQQNDRIFHLLDLNQKYLEKNSTSQEKQSETESKLRKEMESYLKKEIQLEADNKNHLEKIRHLQDEVEKTTLAKNKLETVVEKLSSELTIFKSNTQDKKEMKAVVDGYEEELTKASATITGYKERLEKLLSEKEELIEALNSQKEELRRSQHEVKDFKSKAEEYGKTVKNLTSKMTEERNKSEEKINNFAQLVERLEEEKKSLSLDIAKTKENQRIEIEKQLHQIATLLSKKITLPEKYTAPAVLSIIEKTFNEVISGEKNVHESKTDQQFFKPEDLHKVSAPVPTPRTTNHNGGGLNAGDNEKSLVKDPETVTLKKEEKEIVFEVEEERKGLKETVNETKNESQKTEKVDSRYKTYDQGWRTIKPPPPPLFDDDDDDEEEDENWLN